MTQSRSFNRLSVKFATPFFFFIVKILINSRQRRSATDRWSSIWLVNFPGDEAVAVLSGNFALNDAFVVPFARVKIDDLRQSVEKKEGSFVRFRTIGQTGAGIQF